MELSEGQLIVLGTFFAAIAAIGAIGAVVVQLVLRYRDRIDVRITSVRIDMGTLFVAIRNAGGTPTVVKGTRFVVAGRPRVGTIGTGYGLSHAGRDEAEIGYSQLVLQPECPQGAGVDLVAVEQSGKVSKPYRLDDETVAWIRGRN